jgi:hypothetical protein
LELDVIPASETTEKVKVDDQQPKPGQEKPQAEAEAPI